MKRKATRIILPTLFLASMLFTAFESAYSSNSLVLDGVNTWYWTGDTVISSVAVGDVDGDGSMEIVTGGYYWQWPSWGAQLAVWDGATPALEGVRTWHWGDATRISSLAVGDVDGDGSMEIVTGGHYDDGTRWVAQLAVWDGATLGLEGVRTWHWTSDTFIESVAVGDVDGDGAMEIVTGGRYYAGLRWVAQLTVWDGASLTLEGVKTWYWVRSARISSVAVGDVDGDGSVEIVTGGWYYDNTRNVAQLAVWDGSTLALEGIRVWYWMGHTYIGSVAMGDVDGDGSMEIVTGGYYSDGTRYRAQLAVWDGATLSLESVTTWHWVQDTFITSIAVWDVDGDGSVEIVTGGFCHDGTRDWAQLAVWDGATLALEEVGTWYWVGDTQIRSVAIEDVDGDGTVEIVTGGNYYDGTRKVAQLAVWTKT